MFNRSQSPSDDNHPPALPVAEPPAAGTRRAAQRRRPQLSRTAASLPPPATRPTRAADAAAAGSVTHLRGQRRRRPHCSARHHRGSWPDASGPNRTCPTDLAADRLLPDNSLARTHAATTALRRPRVGAASMHRAPPQPRSLRSIPAAHPETDTQHRRGAVDAAQQFSPPCFRTRACRERQWWCACSLRRPGACAMRRSLRMSVPEGYLLGSDWQLDQRMKCERELAHLARHDPR